MSARSPSRSRRGSNPGAQTTRRCSSAMTTRSILRSTTAPSLRVRPRPSSTSPRTSRSWSPFLRWRSYGPPSTTRAAAVPVSRSDRVLAGGGVVFGLRFGLDLYANVRPTKLYPNVRHKIHDGFKLVWEPGKVDFVIVRENTEGLYTPTRGFLDRGGVKELAVDSRVITRKGAERVIRFAFEVSKQRKGAPSDGKRRVTCVDKSNVTAGCKLFRQVYDEVAARYPTIQRDYAYIDAFQQWLIRSPEVYDVAVTSNLFGDIATDLAAVLQGGMGMAAGGNIGDQHGMFEPIHGSAPKHAGKDEVNPTAMILAVQMMLDW